MSEDNIENELKNEKETKNKSQKFNFKSIVLNGVYLEFIAYFLILMLGVIINAVVYSSGDIVQVIASVFSSILVCAMMYILGKMSAKRKQGIRKYTAPFYILLIFGIITIIRGMLAIIGVGGVIPNLFIYVNNLYIQSCEIIFVWLRNILNIDIGYLCVIITTVMMCLGVRRNILNDKKK